VIQHPHEYQLCTKQSLVKREGVSVATKVLFMSFFSFSFPPAKQRSKHKSMSYTKSFKWFALPEPPRSSHVFGIARGTGYVRMYRHQR
jgi:hypothetical protein